MEPLEDQAARAVAAVVVIPVAQAARGRQAKVHRAAQAGLLAEQAQIVLEAVVEQVVLVLLATLEMVPGVRAYILLSLEQT